MKSVRLAMLLFVTAGFVPLGVLGWFAWVQLAKEETQVIEDSRRKGEVAMAGVRQRYLGRIRDLITRESQRDFTQFQHWHAPLDIQAQAPSVVRSPLASRPEDGFIRYYFQIASDGGEARWSSPHEGETSELELQEYQSNYIQHRLFSVPNTVARDEVMGELGVLLAAAPATAAAEEIPREYARNPGVPGEVGATPGRRLLLARSGPKPISEQTLINEVLLVNFNSREVAISAQRQQHDRAASSRKPPPVDDAWSNLNKNANLDPSQRSVIRVYPYCLHVGQGEKPPVILWRTVVTPTHTLAQGFALDLTHIAEGWLAAELEGQFELQRAAGGIAPDVARRGTVLNPGAQDFDRALVAAFGTLPVVTVNEDGSLRARFETTRGHYAMVAAGYLLVLGLLGFLLLRTVTRHSELVRRQQDFLAAVSHELRTPLSSMRLYTELAMQQAQGGGDDALKRHVDRIMREEDRLTRIIEMLLLSARIERGTLTLDPRDTPLHQPLREAVELARVNHPGREILLAGDELPASRFDRAAATQLFYNLIENGLKYSRESGKLVEVQAQGTAGEVVVRVRDQGCGISKADLGRLFQRFYRGATASSYGAGTGLGLWLCKTYADAMGWRIDIQSRPGEGTCVTVTIPLSSLK